MYISKEIAVCYLTAYVRLMMPDMEETFVNVYADDYDPEATLRGYFEGLPEGNLLALIKFVQVDSLNDAEWTYDDALFIAEGISEKYPPLDEYEPVAPTPELHPFDYVHDLMLVAPSSVTLDEDYTFAPCFDWYVEQVADAYPAEPDPNYIADRVFTAIDPHYVIQG